MCQWRPWSHTLIQSEDQTNRTRMHHCRYMLLFVIFPVYNDPDYAFYPVIIPSSDQIPVEPGYFIGWWVFILQECPQIVPLGERHRSHIFARPEIADNVISGSEDNYFFSQTEARFSVCRLSAYICTDSHRASSWCTVCSTATFEQSTQENWVCFLQKRASWWPIYNALYS